MSRVPIDVVTFDYGNVLSLPQDAAAVERMLGIAGVDPPAFARRYWEHRPAYDTNELDARAYWSRVIGAAPDDRRLARLIAEDVGSWLHLDAALEPWVARLVAAGVRIALLSNMPAEVLAGVRAAHAAWLTRFDVTIYSCEIGVVKPDRAIYDGLIAALGAAPPRVLVIDDREANVAGAEAVGLHAHRYRTPEALAHDVAARFDLP